MCSFYCLLSFKATSNNNIRSASGWVLGTLLFQNLLFLNPPQEPNPNSNPRVKTPHLRVPAVELAKVCFISLLCLSDSPPASPPITGVKGSRYQTPIPRWGWGVGGGGFSLSEGGYALPNHRTCFLRVSTPTFCFCRPLC